MVPVFVLCNLSGGSFYRKDKGATLDCGSLSADRILALSERKSLVDECK